MGLPVSILDLSVRATNCLERANIQTIGDLARIDLEALSRSGVKAKANGWFRNFGKATLLEIRTKLAVFWKSRDLDAFHVEA